MKTSVSLPDDLFRQAEAAANHDRQNRARKANFGDDDFRRGIGAVKERRDDRLRR